MAGKVIEITESNFEKEVAQSSLPVLVDHLSSQLDTGTVVEITLPRPSTGETAPRLTPPTV